MRTRAVVNQYVEAKRIPLFGVLLFITLVSFLTYGDISQQMSDGVYARTSDLNLQLVTRTVSSFALIFFAIGVIFFTGSLRREFARPFSLYFLYFCSCLIPNILYGPDTKSLYFTASLLAPLSFYYLVYIRYGMSFVNTTRVLWTGFYLYYLLILLSVLLSVIIYPDQALRFGFDGRLQSVFIAIGANGLSWIAFIIPLLSLLCHPGRKGRFLVLSLIGGVIMISTETRTTFVSLVLIGLYFLFVRRRFLSLAVCIVCAAVVFLLMSSNLFLIFSRGETQFESLSGRTIMWELLFQQFLNNPIFGLGLWRGSNFALQASAFDFVSQPHNAILEVLVSVGLFGFVIWLAVLMRFRRIFQISLNGIKSRTTRVRVLALRLICIAYVPKLITSSEFVLVDYSFYLLLGLIFLQEAIVSDLKGQRCGAEV